MSFWKMRPTTSDGTSWKSTGSMLRTSPRRWERNGPWRTTAIYGIILALYTLGVPIERLDRLYRRLR